MRWQFIANIIGILLVFLGLSMVVPLLVSIHYHDLAQDNFIQSIGITMAAGLILIILSKKQGDDYYINQKEGMAAVALARSLIFTRFGIYSIDAFSVAKLTVASMTPGVVFSADWTRPTHDAHDIPSTGNKTFFVTA